MRKVLQLVILILIFITLSGCIDNIKPAIVLVGPETITLVQGEEYIEYGASVEDNRDPDLNVHISGRVDINTVGSYILVYSTVDKAGNTAEIVYRTVHVVSSESE